jgi:hypothetical protein
MTFREGIGGRRCPIKADDIPKHIWYVRANGLHGERFAIEFKTEKLVWKSTSSKKVNIQDKLNKAKEKLQEYYLIYPHLNPENPDKLKEIYDLEESFKQIITIPHSISPTPHTQDTGPP